MKLKFSAGSTASNGTREHTARIHRDADRSKTVGGEQYRFFLNKGEEITSFRLYINLLAFSLGQ